MRGSRRGTATAPGRSSGGPSRGGMERVLLGQPGALTPAGVAWPCCSLKKGRTLLVKSRPWHFQGVRDVPRHLGESEKGDYNDQLFSSSDPQLSGYGAWVFKRSCGYHRQ